MSLNTNIEAYNTLHYHVLNTLFTFHSLVVATD